MLRTRGIAARVVNGFLPGEYNEAAGAYTVRQSDAHSWVEVYFPETRSWVTFDPTPSAGRVEPVRTGLTAQLQKYAEALELLWFQYVVGYDKQEQRSLATSLHNQVFDYGRTVSNMLTTIRSYFTGNLLSIVVVMTGLANRGGSGVLRQEDLAVGCVADSGIRRKREELIRAFSFTSGLISLMEQRGLARDKHLTPLEFANTLKSSDALLITRAYNRVRYGGQRLSASEKREVERALFALEAVQPQIDADKHG